MRHWIDGYNLLRHLQLEKGRSLEQARARLVGLVSGAGVRIYFDAQGGGKEQRAGVEVVYSESQSADDRIVADLRSGGGGGITVVTNDRELTNRCKQLGAAVIGCSDYLQRESKPRSTRSQLAPDPARPSGVRTKVELDEWLRLFGEDPTKPPA